MFLILIAVVVSREQGSRPFVNTKLDIKQINMALSITVTFPCTQEEYKKTLIILGAMQKSEFSRAPIKVKTASVEQIESLISDLSDDERKILDFQLRSAHEGNDTPVLDSFKTAELPSLKINRSAQIIEYVRKHPHTSKFQCTEYLATKLAAHYPSRDIAMRRIGNLLSLLVHGKKLINESSDRFSGSYIVAEGV